jgi:hypothetical protein
LIVIGVVVVPIWWNSWQDRIKAKVFEEMTRSGQNSGQNRILEEMRERDQEFIRRIQEQQQRK